jgi:hypothetical protein
MNNNRIPNHKIDSLVANLEEFTNYNETITATRWNFYDMETETSTPTYGISHWSTDILQLNLDTMEIEYLYSTVYSQTTSRLVGRIIRNLPRASVDRFLTNLNLTDPTDAKRLARMAGI